MSVQYLINYLILAGVCSLGLVAKNLQKASIENNSSFEVGRSFRSIYYDPKSRISLRIVEIQNQLAELNELHHQFPEGGNKLVRKIGYRSNGCTCQEFLCGCCLGFNLQQLNFSREGCMNFSYDAQDLAINMNMYMNGNPVFSNTISARYPPPLCIPVIIPYLPASVEFCAKLYDIHTLEHNLQMCFDFETRIQRNTVLILHFDCMRMGAQGVAIVKPGDTLPSSTDSQIDSDVFDEVTEIKYKNNSRINTYNSNRRDKRGKRRKSQ